MYKLLSGPALRKTLYAVFHLIKLKLLTSSGFSLNKQKINQTGATTSAFCVVAPVFMSDIRHIKNFLVFFVQNDEKFFPKTS